jgi:hypothetical protein
MEGKRAVKDGDRRFGLDTSLRIVGFFGLKGT